MLHKTSINTDNADLKQTWISHNELALKAQSRSFAIPILNLTAEYRLPVMVQYNINKLIDTIEDTPALTPSDRISAIQRLCHALQQGICDRQLQTRMLSVLSSEESPIFQYYPDIIALFNCLALQERELGLRWSLAMAEGMCEFLQKPINTPDDLNQYCYFVAGTVGCYLTELLEQKGEQISIVQRDKLQQTAISFGLFLQKLNIIRDYNEDRQEKHRQFWPQDYFRQGHKPLAILNLLCTETLQNDVPAAIAYARTIPIINQSFVNFIRFILVSGLEYLQLLINNDRVFTTTKVKLPKAIIVDLYHNVSQLSETEFSDYCERLASAAASLATPE